MSPYWESQLAPVNRGVSSLGSALAMGPRIQQQAALLQARQAQDQALAGLATARTGLVNTQAQREQLSLSQALALAERFKQPGALTTDKEGNLVIDKGAVADVASAIGGMGKSANDSAEGLANIFKSVNAPNQASLERTNKASIAAASDAERAARPLTVPSGSTLFSPAGQPLGAGGVTLNPGQKRFAATGLAGALSAAPGADDGTNGAAAAPAGLAAPVAVNPPTAKAATGLPDSVQSQLFKQLLENSPGGTNTDVALSGLKAASGAAPAAAPRPTRAMAAALVKSEGSAAAAMTKLKSQGYDVTGYSD